MSETSGYDSVDRALWVPIARHAPELYLALKAVYETLSNADLSDLDLQEEAAAGSEHAVALLKARAALSKVKRA